MCLQHLLDFPASLVGASDDSHAGGVNDDLALFKVFVISLKMIKSNKYENMR